MNVWNPVAPQFYHHITVRTRAGSRRERVERVPSYTCQLRAFAGAVLRGEAIPTGAEDAVRNMRVIDAVYRAAGLPLRGAAA
jgi:predicted dehydrogenase